MAFQSDVFQHDAFQMDLGEAQGRGSGGYSKRGRKKLLDAQQLYSPEELIKYNELLDAARDARLAEEARIKFRKLQDDNALIAILLSS